jgi:hypothetical protein
VTCRVLYERMMHDRNQQEAELAFANTWNALRQDRFYQRRPYTSIGGMWTVDTWHCGPVTAQLLDEGYTQRLLAPGLDVYLSGLGPMVFKTGTPDQLLELAQRVADTVTVTDTAREPRPTIAIPTNGTLAQWWEELWLREGWEGWADARGWLWDRYRAEVVKPVARTPTPGFVIRFLYLDEYVRFRLTEIPHV